MRAAVFTGVNEPLGIEDVEPIPPGPHDVVVQITGSGLCHTDHAVVHGALPMVPPMILGHEVTGTVLEVGSGVSRVRVGDRVIGSGLPVCGNCFFCTRNQSHLCEETMRLPAIARAKRRDGATITAFGSLGGFADMMTVPEASIVPVHTDLPAEQLALIGCAVTTGVGSALNTAAVVPGSTVAVVGLGGIGQFVVQGARIAGAARILAIDPVERKRSAARQQGATDLVDPNAGDTVELVRELTHGRGVDYAFEAVGRADTMLTTYRLARRGGVVVMVGMPPFDSTVAIPGFELFLDAKEIRVSNMGSSQIRRDYPRFVDLAEAGRLDLASMISRRITLDEIGSALLAMEDSDGIRTVIT